jgi:hypothetical protein
MFQPFGLKKLVLGPVGILPVSFLNLDAPLSGGRKTSGLLTLTAM